MKRLVRGFTLIELLVVIAIIGILASIVITSLTAVRDSARVAAGKVFERNVLNSTEGSMVAYWNFDECSGTTSADLSGIGNTATLVGSPTWSSDTPFDDGCSLYFDSSSKYASFTGKNFPTGTSPYTVVGWMKTAQTPATGFIVSWGTITGTNNLTGIGIINGTAQGTWNTASVDSGVVVSDNKWHYVVETFDGTTRTLYVDGSLKATADMSSYLSTRTFTTTSGFIGRRSGGLGLKGNVDNVRVFTQDMTASEVQKLYAEELPHVLAVNR